MNKKAFKERLRKNLSLPINEVTREITYGNVCLYVNRCLKNSDKIDLLEQLKNLSTVNVPLNKVIDLSKISNSIFKVKKIDRNKYMLC